MDGDEKGSGGTAVCDGGTEDEAMASGDVAPAAVDAGPAEPGSAGDVTAVDASVEPVSEQDDSTPDGMQPNASVPEPDDSVPDGSVPDGSVRDEQASADDGAPAAEDAPVVPEVDEAAVTTDATTDAATERTADSAAAPTADGASPARTRRLRPYLRRGVVALVVTGFVALGVGAFAWVAPSPEAADRRFIEAAQSQGHIVTPGEQETLVVSAARKICDRRVLHETDRERRATALSSDEIAAVGTAFGADTRDFTTLALETYCSS